MKPIRYEIQKWSCSGWENHWRDEDGSPVLFYSFEDAEHALKEAQAEHMELVYAGQVGEQTQEFRISTYPEQND